MKNLTQIRVVLLGQNLGYVSDFGNGFSDLRHEVGHVRRVQLGLFQLCLERIEARAVTLDNLK